MASHLDLQRLLEELLESRNVYYKPPESIKMNYPAIRYTRQPYDVKHANDAKYSIKDCYELVVISKIPDHPVIKKLMALQYCSYDRDYVADNLYHDVFTLYF